MTDMMGLDERRQTARSEDSTIGARTANPVNLPLPIMDELIRGHARPTHPIPTGVDPLVSYSRGIQVVLFDVYGTLFVSGSGDIGGRDETSAQESLAAAVEASGVSLSLASTQKLLELQAAQIAFAHAELKADGVEYPEVDIAEIWRRAFEQLGVDAVAGWSPAQFQQFAIEFEMRSNPVWPMPGLERLLGLLRANEVLLGIISNAQFFTPALFSALTSHSLTGWGFERDLCIFSYEHRRAKPGAAIYRLAETALKKRGIEASSVFYLGNDILNDVKPATEIGFRTGLFAGDRRSLRWREDDPRVSGVKPDVIITDLDQVATCVIPGEGRPDE